MNDIAAILSDRVIFPLFQLAFFSISAFALARDLGYFQPPGANLSVGRGEKSWSYFQFMYALLAVVFVEVNSTAEALKGYKTVVTIADLSVLFYLCFFNSWFRNNTLNVIGKSQRKVD